MCKYCKSRDFTTLNKTIKYSGIEISLNDQGILRVRVSDLAPDWTVNLQDIVNIKYCPFCGRKLK